MYCRQILALLEYVAIECYIEIIQPAETHQLASWSQMGAPDLVYAAADN